MIDSDCGSLDKTRESIERFCEQRYGCLKCSFSVGLCDVEVCWVCLLGVGGFA